MKSDEKRITKLRSALGVVTDSEYAISIPGYVMCGSGSDAHYEYEITINLDTDTWSILRRYSRFREMHLAMKRQYGDAVRTNCIIYDCYKIDHAPNGHLTQNASTDRRYSVSASPDLFPANRSGRLSSAPPARNLPATIDRRLLETARRCNLRGRGGRNARHQRIDARQPGRIRAVLPEGRLRVWPAAWR